MGWALLLFAVLIAGVFRFWQLGWLPPGLYRDEAFNGMDALDVLSGKHAVYFPANNGREPAYIYLTALSIMFFGRTALAVRLAAAVIGTLTTWLTYQLAKTWYGQGVGLLSAWLWAVTLWPVHLSRIGLRPILMAPLLAALFWLGTLAYRRQDKLLWLLSGLIFGAGFYTYLAFRLAPLLLFAFLIYLLLTSYQRRIWPATIWFGIGAVIALLPLVGLFGHQPDLLIGRTGQVSVFSPNVNHGDWAGTLGQNLVRASGAFFWRGDEILRHNPVGRPIFDSFMALPFLVGIAWSLRHWRKKGAALLLMWLVVMLLPTILAEDTPHFLRAAGLLPAVVIVPALGLGRLWEWKRLPARVRQLLIIALLAASAAKTAFDYIEYSRSPEAAYLFEAAASELAIQVLEDSPEMDVFVDERFWNSLPSIPFLAGTRAVTLFSPEAGLPKAPGLRATIYAWPYGPLDFVPEVLTPPALIFPQDGGLARGDLDETASPLYIRFASEPLPELTELRANFGHQLLLQKAEVSSPGGKDLHLDLYWQTESTIQQELAVFVHLVDASGAMIAQDDGAIAGGRWPRQWWQSNLLIRDRHKLKLPVPFDETRHRLLIGVYDMYSRVRLPLVDAAGQPLGDVWIYEN